MQQKFKQTGKALECFTLMHKGDDKNSNQSSTRTEVIIISNDSEDGNRLHYQSIASQQNSFNYEKEKFCCYDEK
ncbi:CLUMA_CG013034, isoform A [Clunio marinus]|uniref:CLUMA_CG009219, isoform A n=1 Tax=Clunio marinus TaxID=568069 RepID=A0A1J1I7P8_9DIPT|nr:CLUMA_CG009219, isoform A [Clunio marinus]CRK99779.1 CLUMA_CG013034, isoform A [Clunio marinus]